MDARWTLDELVELVASVLSVGYDGAPNGRVRGVPDRRAVRWYTTVGLVDRPAVRRGRTALYGERHLLQLVAIKRRQAVGVTLARIQQELTGATDATLRGVARLPAGIPPSAGSPRDRTEAPVRHRFWTAPPAAGVGALPAGPVDGDGAAGVAVHGVRLAGGMTLMLPAGTRAPDEAELADLVAAAQPLIEVLGRRGLMETDQFGGVR